MADADFRRWKAAARATPIAEVLDRRGIRLRGGGVERVGGCPVCGDDGKGDADRFSINTQKNVFQCRSCGKGGDPIELVMWLDCLSFLTACAQLTGMEPPGGRSDIDLAALAALEAERAENRRQDAAGSEVYRENERERLFRYWKRGRFMSRAPIAAYLRQRRLTLPPDCKSLRLVKSARLYGEKQPGAPAGEAPPLLHEGPCMYAGISDADGRFAGLHMTWLDRRDIDGKARILDPETGELAAAKKVRGSHKGNRIVLSGPADPEHLVMGEGIETTLSYRDDRLEAGEDLSRTGFWSAINLGNLGGPHDGTVAHPTLKDRGGKPRRVPGPVPAPGRAIIIPDSVTRLTLLGDGDCDLFLVRCTLERASRRWAREGRVIVIDQAPEGADHNSVRRARA